jgi:hypothetical protein
MQLLTLHMMPCLLHAWRRHQVPIERRYLCIWLHDVTSGKRVLSVNCCYVSLLWLSTFRAIINILLSKVSVSKRLMDRTNTTVATNSSTKILWQITKEFTKILSGFYTCTSQLVLPNFLTLSVISECRTEHIY